ncbi:MAG: chromosome segregation protein SMC [Candidatus Omnitrophica bacterium]|nr:chromosome segregation protein SMC [Candidatus Omnitrophota bacterium]
MYLKKIEIFGFKSFAEKTEIVFERGVTCIVGPNGCGKSNISDAIRWVLGERSAKLLRGSRMEDVIFSGTDFRKPLNFAEVSLTIDNSDQKLSVQYEEVVITRRLYRSGESEYLLNKTPCRLKDIQDLILDTGIGSNSYSMIEQGRIDYILNAEAEERRSLIEEAAGISKFKVKKEEALRKLERTEENLLRLNDITSEVERNIRYAERQAQRAERYKTQFDRLKNLEIQRAFFEFQNLDGQTAQLETERRAHQESLSALGAQTESENASARLVEGRLQQLEQSFLEEENTRSETRQALTALENQENFHREKIEFLKLNCEKALGELESLKKTVENLNQDIHLKNNERERISAVIEDIQAKKKENLLNQPPQQNQGSGKQDLENQQAVLFELARQIADTKNAFNKADLELLSLERKQSELKESKAKLTGWDRNLVARQKGAGEEYQNYDAKVIENRNALTAVTQEKDNLELHLKATQSELSAVQAKLAKLESQLRLLEEIDHLAGPDPKKIVSEHGSHPTQQGMMKTLLDLVEIEPGYELAAEAALADSLKAVVADNLEAATHLLTQLKQSGSHHATIFVRDQAILNGALAADNQVQSHPLVKKRLWDVIRVQNGYDGIFGNLVGKTYVVDEITSENIAQLMRLSQRAKLVSKSGAILGPEFQITLRNGGYTPERNTFARKKENTRLNRENEVMHQQEAELGFMLTKGEQRLKELRQKENDLNREMLAYRVAFERIQAASSSFDEQRKQAKDEFCLLEQETRQCLADAEQSRQMKEILSKQLEKLEAEQARAQSEFDRLQKHMLSEKSAQEEIERGLELLESKLEMQTEKEKDVSHAIQFLNRQLEDANTRIQSLESEREKSARQISELEIQTSYFKTDKDHLNQQLLEQSVRVEQVKQSRAQLLGDRNCAIEKIQESAKAIEQLKQKIHELSLKELEITHQKDSIRQDLSGRYKIDLSTLNAQDYTLEAEKMDEVKTEIETLREKLESIGTVNLLAIDEYQELKQRYDFLLNQKRDLTEARDSLLEAIRKINRTTKKLFEETLVHVREAFRNYFRTLFGGGQADLILLDESNPIESGLDIAARPPGKKLQHISLLSGGEKALTAIALLLALFSVKPSPFCVLDEVDAPLDEANNERFLSALKPFLPTTQFIIATHSRKTIAMGDALYGVTMQEAGISKIVSVRLAPENKEIEHTDQKLKNELNQILN